MDKVDWFNVMAYDFFGSHSATVGLNAPICGLWSLYSIDGAIDRIMKEQLSPEKMVLGLPLYGYVYENTDGYRAAIDKKNNIGK
jgi:chitinase